MATSEDNAQNARLNKAKSLIEAGEYDEGLTICNTELNQDFSNAIALFLMGYCFLRAERFGLAYTCFERVAKLTNRPEAWNNMGMCHQETWNLDDAERCFRQSLKLEPENTAALNNMALINVNRCKPEEALQWASKALQLDPEMVDAKDNKALACLMLKQWEEGWQNYEAALGYHKQRQHRVYGEAKDWNGTKGQTLVVYGEQGLGDEIAFASCIPDAIRDNRKVFIDCDQRLEGLFKRSFPEAEIHGTRFASPEWLEAGIDAQAAMGSLPQFYRNRDEDFPGSAYLVPDPERRIQWKALLDTYRKPAIGIAWTGGLLSTGKKKRSLSLEDFAPILKAIPATWVSLQYRDGREEIKAFEDKHGIRIHDWPRATQTKDYDDTAALVAELDLVISVTTAVVHLSGAIGKECWCLAPSKPRWFYGLEGELPWYKSVKMFRQKAEWPINDIVKLLQLRWG